MSDAGEICRPEGIDGLDGLAQMDIASSVVAGVMAPVAAYLGVKAQTDVAKKQLSLEASALKAQKAEMARQAAQQQAEALIEPEVQARNQQIMAMVAIGGIALLLSGFFIISAVKNGGGKKGKR